MNASTIILSPSQQLAEDKYYQFLQDEDAKEFILTGAAGTGKSWLTKHLVKVTKNWFKANKAINPKALEPVLLFTATTNKAAMVLGELIEEHARTIHSTLSLRVMNDYDTGKVKLGADNVAKNLENTILFVDECSLIDGELYKLILQSIGKGSKVIFIGDPYQLPPVKKQISPIFTSNIDNLVYLKEIQRQAADNPIIQESQKFRKLLDDNQKPSTWPEITPDNKHIFHLSDEDFLAKIEEKFTAEHTKDAYRVLAWSNKEVIRYNNHIRSLYTSSHEYQPKEHVITNKHILKGNSIHIPSESSVYIRDIVKQINRIPGHLITIPGYMITIAGVTAFMPEDWAEGQNLIKEYAKAQDWKNYFYVKDHWLDLRPAHAMTVHKAQGSTYQEVFIDLNDIGLNKKWYEVARLVYVALTRASDKVYLRGNLTVYGG